MEKTRSIGFQVGELSRLIKRNIDQHIAELEIEEITGVQAWILGYIYKKSSEGEVFQKDIEKVFRLRRSSVAEILRTMEKNGLIIRESVSHDGRLKKLVLTPRAIALQTQIITKIQEVEKQLTIGLSEGEKILFLELIDKIRKNIS